MPKKRPEMSQVYNQSNNEFIFGENGGRGKHLLSFLKNLSLTGSLKPRADPENIRSVNSSIYGSLAYGYASPDQGGSAIHTLAARSDSPLLRDLRTLDRRSPARLVSSSQIRTLSPQNQPDTGLFRPPSRTMSAELGRPFSRRPLYTDLDDDWDAQLDEVKQPRAHEPPAPTLDSLHPDLTFSSPQLARLSADTRPKELMDSQDTGAHQEVQKLNRLQLRFSKFTKVLVDGATVNIQDLRKLAWNGVPAELRALSWQLLLGYLPTNKTRQVSILKRKRQEYTDGLHNVQVLFDDTASQASLDSRNRDNSANKEKQLYHQINIDVKRTHPTLELYLHAATQRSLRKILYLWAIRHPASGYVQGINDICTPFYQIFLNNYLWQLQRKRAYEFEGAEDDAPLFIPGYLDENDENEQAIYNDPQLASLTWENFDPGRLLDRATAVIEADTYWCILRLFDNITDNYIHEQPGIIKQVNDLRTLMMRIDLPLVQHLEKEGVEFLQFSFRWMNCLLMRELSIGHIVRMWDTYLSETPLGFSNFHVYVCAAFLIKFSAVLKEKDFQDILLFLQNPPTALWKEKDIELMLSEAFIWQSLYQNAGAHLR